MKFNVHFSSALALCTFGCIGAASEYEDEPLASNAKALNAHESCDTVSANKTTWSEPGNWVTGERL